MWKKKNLLSVDQISINDIKELFDIAENIKNGNVKNFLYNKIVAMCFFEPSTRTRLSFESAVYRSKGDVIGFSDINNTSITKSESFSDTIQTIQYYADILVIRKSNTLKYSSHFTKPIINAGDGDNEHPTQALLDIYTIYKKFNSINGISIAIIGDLKYARTTHSLIKILSKYNNIKIHFLLSSLEVPKSILIQLDKNNIRYYFYKNMKDIINHVEILYVTRLQKERFSKMDKSTLITNVHIDLQLLNLRKTNKKDFIIMHPLPRVNEIDNKIDNTKHAYYFKQVQNGLYMRQAILYSLVH